MARGNPANFLSGFATMLPIFAAGCVIFSVIIDPYWRFDLVTLPGINEQRLHVTHQLRLAKPHIVCRLQPTNLIFGSSRAVVGLDPRYEALEQLPGETYNMAMGGLGMWELYVTFRHAVHASENLKLALISLDFLMFNAYREAVVFKTEVFNFDEKRLLADASDSCLRAMFYDLDSLMDLKALRASVSTIEGQLSEDDAKDPRNITKVLALYDDVRFRGNSYLTLDEVFQRRSYRTRFDGINGKAAIQESAYLRKVWFPPPSKRFCLEQPGGGEHTRSLSPASRAGP